MNKIAKFVFSMGLTIVFCAIMTIIIELLINPNSPGATIQITIIAPAMITIGIVVAIIGVIMEVIIRGIRGSNIETPQTSALVASNTPSGQNKYKCTKCSYKKSKLAFAPEECPKCSGKGTFRVEN